jgi:hypothetical protein
MGLGPGPPSGRRSAAPSSTSEVNSPCAPRASHCQYSTIAYWAQQVAGVGRDPRPKRWSSPDITPGGYGNRADAIDYVASPFSPSIYCSLRFRRMGCLLWRSCAPRQSGSYGSQWVATCRSSRLSPCPLRHRAAQKPPFRFRPTQVTAAWRPSRSSACYSRQPESGLTRRLVR